MALAKRAKRVLEVDSDLRRTYYNKKPHIFTLEKNSIINQLFAQLKTSKKDITKEQFQKIEEAVEVYIKDLKGSFRARNRNNEGVAYYIKDIPGGFRVFIKNLNTKEGKDIYDQIYRVRSRREGKLKKLVTTVQEIFKDDPSVVNSTVRHLFDIGHTPGQSIAEKTVQRALYRFTQLPESSVSVRDYPQIDNIIKIAIESKDRSGPYLKEFAINVIDEAARDNQYKGRTDELEFIEKARSAINKFIEDNGDWYNQQGSRSAVDVVIAELLKASAKAGARNITKPKSRSPDSKSESQSRSKSSTPSISKASAPQITVEKAKRDTKQQTWYSLLNIINSQITERVMKNMKFPKLQNRTGTFAQSVRVVSVETTNEGFPSFVFDYERNPYDVFDRSKGRSPWNTPERDPKTLIDMSIREIVRELAIGRFYTRRA